MVDTNQNITTEERDQAIHIDIVTIKLSKHLDTEVIVENYSLDWTRQEGCDMIFTFKDNSWHGKLKNPGQCFVRENVTVAILKIHLTRDGIDSRDLGYNSEGEKVFGGTLMYKFKRGRILVVEPSLLTPNGRGLDPLFAHLPQLIMEFPIFQVRKYCSILATEEKKKPLLDKIPTGEYTDFMSYQRDQAVPPYFDELSDCVKEEVADFQQSYPCPVVITNA